jgi:succinyl-CoA synthetase beta subunit
MSGSTLSEADSKALLVAHGVPVAAERRVPDADAAVDAASSIGYPVVVKLNGDAIAHKTERGLVRLRLGSPDAVREAATALLAAARPADGAVDLLVARMVQGNRELIAGVVRDPVFGPAVMLGVGGVLAEAVADVVFRLVPVSPLDAAEMIDDLATQALLGAFRGEPAVDRGRLAEVLVGLSALAEAHPEVVSVDVNPLIIADGGVPVAVDGLVEVTR